MIVKLSCVGGIVAVLPALSVESTRTSFRLSCVIFFPLRSRMFSIDTLILTTTIDWGGLSEVSHTIS